MMTFTYPYNDIYIPYVNIYIGYVNIYIPYINIMYVKIYIPLCKCSVTVRRRRRIWQEREAMENVSRPTALGKDVNAMKD